MGLLDRVLQPDVVRVPRDVVVRRAVHLELRRDHDEPRERRAGGVVERVFHAVLAARSKKIAEEVRRFCAPLVGPSGGILEIVVRPGDAAKEIRKEASDCHST